MVISLHSHHPLLHIIMKRFSSVQSFSRVRLFVTPWIVERQASLSIAISRNSLRLNVHWVSDAIQPSHPGSSLLLLPPIPSSIRVFSNESTLRMRWPKYWSISFSIIPSKEHPGLISFRMDSNSKVFTVCIFDLANTYLGIYPKTLKNKHTELYHRVVCLSVVYNSKNWKPFKFPIGQL